MTDPSPDEVWRQYILEQNFEGRAAVRLSRIDFEGGMAMAHELATETPPIRKIKKPLLERTLQVQVDNVHLLAENKELRDRVSSLENTLRILLESDTLT